jgi:hypothetical protein
MTTYLIKHDESDCEWTEEDLTEEDLYKLEAMGCDVTEVTESDLHTMKGGIKTMEDQTEDFEFASRDVEVDLGAIQAVERAGGIDAELYAGRRVPIEKIVVKEEIDFYHGTPTYDPNSKEKTFRVYVYTVPLKELVLTPGADAKNPENWKFGDKVLQFNDDKGNVKQVIVHARFPLQRNKEGKPEISKHPKATLWKFMKKMGVNTLPELKGKLVMLDAKPSKNPEDERKFLRIVTE